MKRKTILLLTICLSAALGAVLSVIAMAQWTPQTSGTTARLRGVSAVNAKVAWASGSRGTYVRTIDGGASWQAGTVPGAERLDFRDVDAFDANTAYLLSIGNGESSQIYKTTDGGQHWTQQFINRNPKAFFDSMAFWDAKNGLAVSDPVDGRFVIIRTTDGGGWKEIPPENMPPALEGEGAFAASGTCLRTQGKNNVWFSTGGAKTARVFRSTDRGLTWQVAATPIIAGVAAAGIFSVAFKDAQHGIVVGGTYNKESEARDNVAITSDGGKTWQLITGKLPGGFRSGVAYVPGTPGPAIIAVGPLGSDYSLDQGNSWTSLGTDGADAISIAGSVDAIWATGANGRIMKFVGRLPEKQKSSR